MATRLMTNAGRWLLGLLLLLAAAPAGLAAEPGPRIVRNQPGWPVVFELDPGQSCDVAGKSVKLVSFEEHVQPDYWIDANPDRKTFASADVVVDVAGERATLTLRPYQLPVAVNGLRLYVEMTREWATKCEIEPVDGMERAVRLSARPAGEPWGPADLVFPIRDYRWRSSTYYNTWSSLVPYNRLYYHRGEDFGAIPDRLDVLAMFDGTVAKSPLPKGDGQSNGLTIRHSSGLELRYAHMNTETIRPELTEGAAVKAGQVLAKTGMTWSGRRSQTHDPHLHTGFAFEGTRLSSYPFMVDAYFRAYPDALLPVAGGYYFTTGGGEVRLDGSRTAARPGRRVASYRWVLHDGRTIDGPAATVRYDRPGCYAEELIVKADDGTEDRDFAQVRVWDAEYPAANKQVARGWVHLSPGRGVKPGTPVLFWNRLAGTVGPVSIDFGDGSVAQEIKAEATHAFAAAGVYTVAVAGKGKAGEPIMVKLRVVVE